MIIYNPHNEQLFKARIKEAERILTQIPAKYCFITGSFLYKEYYKDIDIFVLTRSKKRLALKNKKAKVTVIDFNDLSSLFYHSISKSCLAKDILPSKPLKVTFSDYWQVINEAIPNLLNQKGNFQKTIRFLVLYTEYFRTGEILDTVQLNQKINSFKKYLDVIEYIKRELPSIVRREAKPSYIKRFFYTQAGYYRDLQEYEAQRYLYQLTHEVTRGIAHG
ncbi:MAG: hypothetical protein WCV90_01495 [Candidatus Woesearchaeota archaeon]